MGKIVAYCGTYTPETIVGIHVYDVNVDTGELKERSVAEISNPSYVVQSKDHRFLYSIEDEGVASFRIGPEGDLEKMNSAGIRGMRGCFLETDTQNRYLFVGGYHDGKVTMLKLNEDGSIDGVTDGIFHQGVAFTANERRIDHPEVSCVKLTRDDKYLLASDHGLNQIKVYQVDYEAGKLKLKHIIRCVLDAAPRSIRFSKDGKFVYILDEVANMIEVYRYHVEDDEPYFDVVQRISVLDRRYRTVCEASCMCISFDDEYVYASINGYNGVSCLKRDKEDGTLAFEQIIKTSGDFPKSVSVLPGNKYMCILNHDSNDIRTFRVYHEERPYALMKSPPVKVKQPNCIRIIELPD